MGDVEITNNESVAVASNDDEQKTKDEIKQRREARRKKILDNAKNRLERLNGRTASDNATDENAKIRHEHSNGPKLTTAEIGDFSDPEVEPDILPTRSFPRESGSFMNANFESNGTTLPYSFYKQQQPWTTNDFSNMFDMFQEAPAVQERHILIRARLHLIVSALISSIFAIFWRDIGFNIFIPAGLCVVTDLLFFREQKPLHPILNIVFMMFSNRLPPQAKNCLHIFSIIQSIIVDLGVFVFSFCTLFYLLFICTNSHFTDLLVIT